MRPSTLIIGLGCFFPLVIADRGTAPNVPYDSTSNTEPDESPSDGARRFRRGQAGAAPEGGIEHYSFHPERSIFKRHGTVSFDANCDEPPPKKSKYEIKDFPTKRSVLEQAYDNARTLADGSQDIDANSFAFTHYFGGEGSDEQHSHFKAMMTAIASNDINYNINFECSGKGGGCKKKSVAVTDATAGQLSDQKTINICDAFWTAATTKYLLYRDDKTEPSPPYRENDDGGWCHKDKDNNSKKKANFFATAGHTILHELTHLDVLGQKAGLTPDEDNRHGTIDPQENPELEGARDFLDDYEKKKKDTSPDYNAESYAAAASEAFFMKTCGFREIKPLVFND